MPLGPWPDRSGGCFECRGRSLGFDGAIALGPYEGPIRDLCLRLKHERNAWIAPWLAELLVEARAEVRLGPVEACVVPVPLHWWRQWSRGYNQAEALARGLADRLSLRLVRPLRRVKGTPPLAAPGPDRAGQASARGVPGRTVAGPSRPDRAAGRRHPDHGRDLSARLPAS